MVSDAMERALQFLRNHKDVALATSEGDIPKLRIFQVIHRHHPCLYGAAVLPRRHVYVRKRQAHLPA